MRKRKTPSRSRAKGSRVGTKRSRAATNDDGLEDILGSCFKLCENHRTGQIVVVEQDGSCPAGYREKVKEKLRRYGAIIRNLPPKEL